MSLFWPERRNAVVTGTPTYNPFDNPSVPLSAVGLDVVFGALNQTDSGEPVTVDRAITLPTMIRCVSLLATVVAGCPLEVYKNPGRHCVTDQTWVLRHDNPETTYTPFELWELVTAHLGFWGNAYVLKVRNFADMIIDLKPVNPALVEVKLDRTSGNKIFLIKHVNPDGTITTAAPQVFTTWEIMHIPGFGYDGLKGLSPVQVAAQTIGIGIASDKLAAKFYRKGSQLTGVIKVKAPLANQAQADLIKSRWLQRNAGTAHAGEVAVLDAETDFMPLTIPPDQLQFLESRRWGKQELATLYGIPPHLVGDVERSTSWGAGIEVQNSGLMAYTTKAYFERIQQRVGREIVNTRGKVASFDTKALMRGTTLERYQAYAVGIQAGWLIRNEVRATEDMEPVEGLDEPLQPMNMIDPNLLDPGKLPGMTKPPSGKAPESK